MSDTTDALLRDLAAWPATRDAVSGVCPALGDATVDIDGNHDDGIVNGSGCPFCHGTGRVLLPADTAAMRLPDALVEMGYSVTVHYTIDGAWVVVNRGGQVEMTGAAPRAPEAIIRTAAHALARQQREEAP